MSLFPPLIIQH